jgi:hypothetical protein
MNELASKQKASTEPEERMALAMLIVAARTWRSWQESPDYLF